MYKGNMGYKSVNKYSIWKLQLLKKVAVKMLLSAKYVNRVLSILKNLNFC